MIHAAQAVATTARRASCQSLMKNLLLAALLCTTGCASHPPGSLEYQAETLNAPDMEAAIRAAKPGEPRCDAACRRAAGTATPPG